MITKNDLLIDKRVKKLLEKNHSKSSSIISEFYKKNDTKNEENYTKTVKLGDKFGKLFNTRGVVPMQNRLLTPTSEEKNFEIKRMIFCQNRQLNPDLSNDYVRKLTTLLNTKDKNFFKNRKILKDENKRLSFYQNKDNLEKYDVVNYLKKTSSQLAFSSISDKNLITNSGFKPYNTRNKEFKTKSLPQHIGMNYEEISRFNKIDLNRFVDDSVKKSIELNNKSKIENEITKNNIANINLRRTKIMKLFKDLNDSEDQKPEEMEIVVDNPILNKSVSEISNLEQCHRDKLHNSLIKHLKGTPPQEAKKQNIFQFGRKVIKERNQIPHIRKIKVLYNGVKMLNNNLKFDKEFKSLYSHKSSDQKKKSFIKEEIFNRVKKIDEIRGKKLKELFLKKEEL